MRAGAVAVAGADADAVAVAVVGADVIADADAGAGAGTDADVVVVVDAVVGALGAMLVVLSAAKIAGAGEQASATLKSNTAKGLFE